MKISFVIPAYNSVTWLPHAVTSALNQKNAEVEVVVVNDGSTDRTAEYLSWLSANEPRAKVLNLETNKGRSHSRNLGNAAATGDVICVLDADDLATPNRAEIVARKFRAGGVDYLYGPATRINCLGYAVQTMIAPGVSDGGVIRADVLRKDVLDEQKNPRLFNGIVHSTAAYTKQYAERFKYPTGDLEKLGCDDWGHQVLGIAGGAKFDIVTQKLACYRVLSSQTTANRNEIAVMEAKRAFLAALSTPV